ncbi:hypothetical protein EON64_06755 [archaeon]|nr:MAG: hypothetical protein EON64_06755 [archaeon]
MFIYLKDYDHPAVKEQVQRLVQEEMKSMTPMDYLSRIPGIYSSERLGEVMKHVEKVMACCKRCGCEITFIFCMAR